MLSYSYYALAEVLLLLLLGLSVKRVLGDGFGDALWLGLAVGCRSYEPEKVWFSAL